MNRIVYSILNTLYYLVCAITLLIFIAVIAIQWHQGEASAAGEDALIKVIIEQHVFCIFSAGFIMLFHKFNRLFPFTLLFFLIGGSAHYIFFAFHEHSLSETNFYEKHLAETASSNQLFSISAYIGWAPALILVLAFFLLLLYGVFRQPVRLAATIVAIDHLTCLSGLFILILILFLEAYALVGIYFAVKGPQLLSALTFYLYERFNWITTPASWIIAMQCIVCYHQWLFVHTLFLFAAKYSFNQLYAKLLLEHINWSGTPKKSTTSLQSIKTQFTTLGIYGFILSSIGRLIVYSFMAPAVTLIRIVAYLCRKPLTSPFLIQYSYPGLVSYVVQHHIDALYSPEITHSIAFTKRSRLDSTTSSIQVAHLSSKSLTHRLELFMLFFVTLFICNPFILFYYAIYVLAAPFLSFAIFLSCLALDSEDTDTSIPDFPV